jgi:hypothetical protein
MVKPATEILCRFFLPKAARDDVARNEVLEDSMNSDAALFGT